MKIRFWGVRGSIAAPGPHTVRYGGNTSCTELTLSDGTTIIFDAGTGLRMLGLDMLKNPRKWPMNLLLSHHHWDHIQGFPFFIPIYNPKFHLKVYPFRKDAKEKLFSLLEQMDGVHFPIPIKAVPSNVEIINPKQGPFKIGPAQVRKIAQNHPGGGFAFQVREGRHQMVYMTDNEIDAPQLVTPMEDLVEFCRGSDLLIHDSQYTADEIKSKKGWGHSSIEKVVDLAAAAEVRCLVLFHHDPPRTDDALDELQKKSHAEFSSRVKGGRCIAAAEGMILEINSSGVKASPVAKAA